ncbi:NAD(P) transhydrogenase subunit alpha [Serinicoccus chungangensis]|uniref:proton-translocating NAD(P)(+) transhydrogenase n=1 Tax=Serinicoccus chungangensis TaxID=767452 RepID=A0A0W8IEX6_9MICO|nr:Re/Si-specific NAD(P)(+) transhydrogenase subunit alpha [Serinicoccus chungangensis]KUG58438.1 NAD(P) transhydrogenase subunit alpha [Serinicoccus chungangensis]
MLIGIPREPREAQAIVAATPTTVTALRKRGHEVLVERGAGERASCPDVAYAEAGARLADRAEVLAADLVLQVDAPTTEQLDAMRPGGAVASLMAPARAPELLTALAAHGVTGLAMDAVPRISRAQSLDVLSSMANLAGYRAVIEAAHDYGGMLAGQVTAAGTTPPATVFVVGAGVAGLAAIGAAQSLGAQVRAFDVRPEVAEQVESMGATFVSLEVEVEVGGGRSDGYAGELTEDAERATQELYAQEAMTADIVVTTALIPGRPAPRLIDAGTVAAMRPGSVVVDLAAANGGNVEGTIADQRVVTDGGVTLLGWTDLAGRMPAQASQLYGTNMVNLVALLAADPRAADTALDDAAGPPLVLDLEDQVLRAMTVAHDGEVLWPPPQVAVSAAPAPAPDRGEAAGEPGARHTPDDVVRDPRRRRAVVLTLAVLAAVGAAFAPDELRMHLTVFALAVIAGYYVISHVTHALHTPLMSVTNAISGIICVGAILQVGSDNTWVTALALVGITVASINIFGGFTVTHRMLGMFRRADS